MINISENKGYKKYSISNNLSIFRGRVEDYEIPVVVLERLSKDLGFSYSLYISLLKINEAAADSLVLSMSTDSKYLDIVFLVDNDSMKVVDYTLDSERLPVLNSEFISRIEKLATTSDAIKIDEIYYDKDNVVSSVILKKIDPIIVEEKYENKESNIISYSVGILITNDELNSSYCRLVLYLDNHPLYLPASYYNVTTSRYRRSTSSSVEALEVLALRVIEDLREDTMRDKIYEIHYKYRANKDILASYEEYNSVMRVMRRVPTIIEDNSFLDDLLSQYDGFEKKYSQLGDLKSSYIWRCTALGGLSVGALISITIKILNALYASPVEYSSIRELLGNYISTNRIAEEIAREDIK